ncbi:hypothetical protein BDN70DRAFT_899679 [Pholiota conissans]|uniref:Uncharacterized protein n=1 Tax=Pholiota conissans TaxID=109636 RepID=A0A9P5YQH9_9AGAR|nr:hypothetical protein BDN70DRAFT_899679 [Pholiota conissans]
MSTEDDVSGSKRPAQDALQLGPRKKPCTADPLVHHGRHFGRTIHALCNLHALINNGIIRMGERVDEPDAAFSEQEQREHKIFLALLLIVPGLEERFMTSSEEEVHSIAAMLQKGASSARSDDTKSLKPVIIDWLVPYGQPLIPPIPRNSKIQRGFNHERTGALLCPAGVDWADKEQFLPRIKEKLRNAQLSISGDQWPIFLYHSYTYDENDPWKGLLRSEILTFKHIFTSPSSVEREAKATRSGNARIHGMTRVTHAAIAYAATQYVTQAKFALSSQAVFSRTDTISDNERFYNSILLLLQDPDEILEITALLTWWNSQVFPNYIVDARPISGNSALSRIKEKRALAKRAALQNVNM